MTKEETLDMIIDDYKNGSQSAMEDYCNGTRCDDCQFDFNDCMNDVAKTLTERLLKVEERPETNLEHFRGTVVFDKANGIVHIHLINGWEKNYTRPHKGAIDWFLSPYEEPPKSKFKLTKFEHDLLNCYDVNYVIIELWLLTIMQSKGYFKGIPTDVPIKDILDNCEVEDGEQKQN